MKYEVMRHMLDGRNIGFVSARSNKSQTQDQFFVTNLMSEVKLGEATTGSVLFPLWLHPAHNQDTDEEAPDALFAHTESTTSTVANIGIAIKDQLKSHYGWEFIEQDHGDLVKTVGARDVFDYTYAVTYSRAYRVRYADFMRTNYPRIPLLRDSDTFRELQRLGNELVALHTLTAPDLDEGIVIAPTRGTNVIDAIAVSKRWEPIDDDGGRLLLNIDGAKDGQPQAINGVPEQVWGYQVGGHHVLHKWLDARSGDKLTHSEIMHLIRTINAIERTLGVIDSIDELVTASQMA